MNFINALLLVLPLAACGTNFDSRSPKQGSLIPEDCCTHWSADGKCLHEKIPGCAKANNQRTHSPDNCCSHWSADGKCMHELVQGCSNSP
jgi:hypothetical protein